MDVIYLYLLTVPVFFAIDMVWLGFAARTFYRSQLGPLLRPSVNWPAAILFYLLYILGMMIFAVGVNLVWGKKFSVANMLPTLIFAALWPVFL